MNDGQVEEFRTLREEILNWQSKRFDILKLSILALTIVVGGAVAQSDKWQWALSSSCVFVILGISAYLTWLFSVFVSVGGAYIEVFLEGDWDRRNRQLRITTKVPKLNDVFTVIYLVLAIIANVICYVRCLATSISLLLLLWLPTLLGFLYCLFILKFKSYPRSKSVERWIRVKHGESEESPEET
jgi:hypothetical protein